MHDLNLERYLLGELPVEKMKALAARLETDPALRERLNALKASREAILRDLPPEAFARRLQARLRRQETEEALHRSLHTGSRAFAFLDFPGAKPLLGSLALLVVLAVPIMTLRSPQTVSETNITPAPANPGNPSFSDPEKGTEGTGQSPAPSVASSPVPSDEIRLKGLEPHLAIFRKTDHGAEPLAPGAKAHPGEQLRIGYQSGGYPFGAILSVDGDGKVTLHWPVSGNHSGRLENGEALLPAAFELDSAPEFERFYLVVSRKPFELAPLRETLHRNESLPELTVQGNSDDVQLVRFDVLKENGI